MIAEAPRVAEEVTRRQREELLMRASEGGSRLDVSLALQDKRYGDAGAAAPAGSLRKERREGRIVFLVLVIALAGRGDLAGEPSAFLIDGRGTRSRRCLRSETGAAQFDRRKKRSFSRNSSATF